MPNSTEGRLTKLEEQGRATTARLDALDEGQQIIRREMHDGQQAARHSLDAFVAEWREHREREANKRAEVAMGSRLTLPQLIAMAASIFGIAVGLVGGTMFLIRTESETVRADVRRAETATFAKIEAESAKTALQVRGQQDNITASQAAMQNMSRDMGQMAVKLGLVEQLAGRNTDLLKELSSYDALLARQEERTKALQDQVKILLEPKRQQ